MGSLLEFNDTLQLTPQQGFPNELNVTKHLKKPFEENNFSDRIFPFYNKSGIRFFHTPPTRTFLVENKNGKWIYWGLVQITEITYDYERKMTSGKFRIIYINTPEEMEKAHELVDRRDDKQYFS